MGNDPRACAIVPTGNTLANVSGWLLPMIGFALREITGVYARKALVVSLVPVSLVHGYNTTHQDSPGRRAIDNDRNV